MTKINENPFNRKLSDKELIEFIWEMRGNLYLLATELERRLPKEEKL
jgi:hypothetical protein